MGESTLLGELIVVLRDVFIWVLKRVGDLCLLILDLCILGGLLAACAVPWRTVFVLRSAAKHISGADEPRLGLREVGCAQVWASVCDLVALPLGLAALTVPWRVASVADAYADALGSSDGGMPEYNGALRFTWVENFWMSVNDVVHVPLFLGALPLHGTELLRELCEKSSGGSASQHKEDEYYDWSKRAAIRYYFCLTMLDIIFVPLVLCVLLSGWRTRSIYALVFASRPEPASGAGGDGSGGGRDKEETQREVMQMRCAVVEEFIATLFDTPFVVLLVLLVVTGWRAGVVWQEVAKTWAVPSTPSPVKTWRRYSNATSECRAVIGEQVCLLLRDVPFFGAFALLVGTLYRAPKVVFALAASRITTRADEPRLHPTAVAVELPKGGGAILHVRATKTAPGFTLQARSVRVSLQVAGEPFWESAARALGGTAALAARMLLPLRLTPKHLAHDAIEASGLSDVDAHNVQFAINLNFPAKRSTIVKKLGRISGTMLLQLEYVGGKRGGSSGVLLALNVSPADVLQSAKAALAASDAGQAEAEWVPLASLPMPPAPGPAALGALEGRNAGYPPLAESDVRRTVPPISDVFWVVVGAEFAQLALDAAHLLLLIVLGVTAPWRLVKALALLLQPDSRWHQRVTLKSVQLLDLVDLQHARVRRNLEERGSALLKIGAHDDARLRFFDSARQLRCFGQDLHQATCETQAWKRYWKLVRKFYKPLLGTGVHGGGAREVWRHTITLHSELYFLRLARMQLTAILAMFDDPEETYSVDARKTLKGMQVRVKGVRNGKECVVESVFIARRGDGVESGKWVKLSNMSNGRIRQAGFYQLARGHNVIRVAGVDPGGPSKDTGLRIGDRILKIADLDVECTRNVHSAKRKIEAILSRCCGEAKDAVTIVVDSKDATKPEELEVLPIPHTGLGFTVKVGTFGGDGDSRLRAAGWLPLAEVEVMPRLKNSPKTVAEYHTTVAMLARAEARRGDELIVLAQKREELRGNVSRAMQKNSCAMSCKTLRRRDTSLRRKMIRTMGVAAANDLFSAVLVAVICATVYRLPELVRVREQCKLLLLDVVALATVYSCMSIFVVWRTYKWTLATVLWGVFVPAEMIAQMLRALCGCSSSRAIRSAVLWLQVESMLCAVGSLRTSWQ
eukprot:g3101.t1